MLSFPNFRRLLVAVVTVVSCGCLSLTGLAQGPQGAGRRSAGTDSSAMRAAALQQFTRLERLSRHALDSGQLVTAPLHSPAAKGTDPSRAVVPLVIGGQLDVPGIARPGDAAQPAAPPEAPGQAAPGSPPAVPAGAKLAVKVWGQLAVRGEGGGWVPTQRVVNLAKYQWKPGEAFYLCVQPAVPVQMAIFQVGPEQVVQRSPDPRHDETYGTLLPGKVWRSPVPMILDQDERDEVASFVFVRADAGLPINTPATPVQLILVNNTTRVVIDGEIRAQATARVVTSVPAAGDSQASESQPAALGAKLVYRRVKSVPMELAPDRKAQTDQFFEGMVKLVYRRVKGNPAQTAVADEAARLLALESHPAPAVVSAAPGDVSEVYLGQGKIGLTLLTFRKR